MNQTVLRAVEKSATEVIGMDPVTVKARSTAQLLLGKIPGGGGALPYMGYIGMCGPKGSGFSAVLVINRVSNLADSGHK